MDLNAENTAIVLDSTADFPEAATRFPSWRIVPLYVRFGDESFRDYEELARDADDLAADARRLPRRLRGAGRVRSDPLAAHRVEALGNGAERADGGGAGRGRPG